MWLHTNGDIRKVAACKVRPYELINTQDSQDSQSQSKKKKVVMLEDGLADLKDIHYVEKDWTGLIEEEKDCIGARYLKVVNHMSFSDYAIFTVELPVFKHGTQEVKEAKQTEVKI